MLRTGLMTLLPSFPVFIRYPVSAVRTPTAPAEKVRSDRSRKVTGQTQVSQSAKNPGAPDMCGYDQSVTELILAGAQRNRQLRKGPSFGGKSAQRVPHIIGKPPGRGFPD